jgi:hypothetical protein
VRPLAPALLALLIGCQGSTLGAGGGLGAVSGAEITTRVEAPEPRAPETILPTPPIRAHPHPPRPVETTAEGTLYVARVDFHNESAAPVRIPGDAIATLVRTVDAEDACALRAVAMNGVPVLQPGERRVVVVHSLCPTPDRPHEVVSRVELPELLGPDDALEGRTVVADARAP